MADNFDAARKRINRLLDGITTEFAKQLALSVRDEEADRTPLVTGRAAASWNVRAGQPNSNAKPVGYNNPGGARRDGEVDLSDADERTPIFVTNNVPYIGKLNRGSSTMAPAAFVENGLAAVILNTKVLGRKVRAGLKSR